MGQLFKSFNNLFIITIFLYVILNILSFKNLNEIQQLILCLNPFSCLIIIFRYLFLIERSMFDLDLNKKYFLWTPILSQLLFICFLSSIFYWVLIWYFEQIFPGLSFFQICLIILIRINFFKRLFSGPFGIGLSWKFPFTKEYWKSFRKTSFLFERKSSNDKSSFESLSTELNSNSIIVQVKSIEKYFPQTNHYALYDISFNLYENQITALIGHNGAGLFILSF